MNISHKLYNQGTNNNTAFKGIYATMGNLRDNRKIIDEITQENEIYNEQYSNLKHKKFKSGKNIEGIYQFDVLQLTPNDSPTSIQLLGTNENALDLAKFQHNNKHNYDFNLYTGDIENNTDLRAQRYYERGEIDNFLDCILEKRKRIAIADPMVESNRIVKALRKQANIHFGFVPIIQAENVLELIKKGCFDFVKGIPLKK